VVAHKHPEQMSWGQIICRSVIITSISYLRLLTASDISIVGGYKFFFDKSITINPQSDQPRHEQNNWFYVVNILTNRDLNEIINYFATISRTVIERFFQDFNRSSA
jgi:hypothetical protein